MLDIEAGEEILYVGDHLYADVLRSKRALGWRSCFIMPELPEEMRIFQSQLGLRSQIMELRKLRDELSSYADNLRRKFDQCVDDSARAELETKIAQCEDDDHKVKEKLSDANKDYHASFHPRWGQMFVVSNLVCFEFFFPTYPLLRFRRTLIYSTCNLNKGWIPRFPVWIFCEKLRLPLYKQSNQLGFGIHISCFPHRWRIVTTRQSAVR